MATLAQHRTVPQCSTARVIRSVVTQAYPSGANIDDDLVDMLFQPTQREGATEVFAGSSTCSTIIWPPSYWWSCRHR